MDASTSSEQTANAAPPDPPLLVLADGRSVVLVPVGPQDSAAQRDFVGALSPSSRYRRFHHALRELSPELARALTAIDQDRHVAFVARPAGSDGARGGRIVADVRYVLCADSAEAEFAIAISDEWQGAGLGRALMTRLSEHARARGVRRLFGDVLQGNGPMIALVRRLGGRLRHSPGDAAALRAELALRH
jgi:acetyltransferase